MMICQENMSKIVIIGLSILGEKNGVKGGEDCIEVEKKLNRCFL